MGAGKTWMGKQIGLLTGLPTYDLDASIEQQEGAVVSTLFKQKGEDYFRLLEQKYLHAITTANSQLVLSCGGGTPCFFDNLDFMKKNGIVVWLNPSVAVLANRLQLAGQDRPLLEGIPSHKLEEYIQLKLKERFFFYEQAHFQLSESTPDPAALIKLIQHG